MYERIAVAKNCSFPCLAKVSTDSAKLIPLGKDSTAIETLKKNYAKGFKCKLKKVSLILESLVGIMEVGHPVENPFQGNEGDMTLLKYWQEEIKEFVSKQGMKSAKAEPSVHKDPLFDELPEDTLDYMETEDAQDVGRIREVVNEEKETVNDEVSTEYVLSTAKQNVRRRATPTTPTTTPTMFGDDETIAQVLLNMSQAKAVSREKEKGVELKDIEDDRLSSRLQDKVVRRAVHVEGKSNKHSELKSKTFEEIQALYEKVKRFDESFTTVGSTEDERRIKEMNKGVKDTDQKRLKEEDTTKVPAKVEMTEQGTKKRKGGHVKMIARKKPRKQSDVDSDDEHRKCLKIITFEGTIDSEIMEKKSVIARLNKVSSPDRDYLVIYKANGNFRAFNYLMEKELSCLLWGDLKDNDGILNEETVKVILRFMQRLLDLELEVEEKGFQLTFLMVKSWLVQDQTVLGKDYSNLLIADSLLKTIWFINAPCYGNEALASLKANGIWLDSTLRYGELQDHSDNGTEVWSFVDAGNKDFLSTLCLTSHKPYSVYFASSIVSDTSSIISCDICFVGISSSSEDKGISQNSIIVLLALEFPKLIDVVHFIDCPDDDSPDTYASYSEVFCRFARFSPSG
ncbi:hypothetical protein Tco_0937760 [Tanacetum coccineum]|uniref:Uncharacterized protein n=1 Tax=Tanacetum coccineum TaxID=301880 RepID=A0ABQ5DF62_9ASTR